ncbi:MAG: hypothetical protein ABIW82_04075 [Dokdonella sp.]
MHHSMARAVLLLQLKLLLGALRDFLLSPLSLAAAVIDVALSKRQPPRYFRGVLQLGERSDEWIDLWSGAREESAAQRENVDALMRRVEEVLRDPQSGARRTRVLKRWAQRQVSRARLRITAESTGDHPSDGGPAAK